MEVSIHTNKYKYVQYNNKFITNTYTNIEIYTNGVYTNT